MTTKKGTILVVEDEEKIARVLELELEYEGYTVTKVIERIYPIMSENLLVKSPMIPYLDPTYL